MAKIVYAVNAEGMGHALRSKVIIDHLLKEHDVVIVSSGRAYEFLRKNFNNVYDIHYYHIVYEDNEVARFKTLISNLKQAPKGIPKAIKNLFTLLYKWKPDLIITDFEPFSDFLSRLFMIPVIAVDNINTMIRTDIGWEKEHILDYALARMVARTFVIGAHKYILTSFFFPKIKKPANTVFAPPSLRPEILAATPTIKDHILVYQTSKSNEAMLEMFKTTDHKFIVYGFDRDEVDKNITFKPFSEKGFIDDIASAKAIVVNGGFTVLSEAVYLRKPILSVPVKHQFEQILNARYVEKMGYGMFVKEITREKLEEFISNLDTYRKSLATYEQDGNKKLFEAIDKAVEEVITEKKHKAVQMLDNMMS